MNKKLSGMLTLGLLFAPAGLFLPAEELSAQEFTAGGGGRQVAEDAWQSAGNRFARLLADGDLDGLILGSMTDSHSIRRLDGTPTGIETLAQAVGRARWSRVFCYSGVPDRLASDIASAVNSENLTDPSLRRFLIPSNEVALREADLTALKWIASVLAPRSDQPVGVLVLHERSADAPGGGTVSMILFSGERVGARLFRIRNAAFGQFDVPLRQ